MVAVVQGYSPVWTFLSNSGQPLVGGKLFSYGAGTSTPSPTYIDSTGVTQNTNPIILNSRGDTANSLGVSCGVWWPQGTALKFVLQDAAETPIWSQDNVLPPISTVVIPAGSVTDASLSPSSVIYAIDQTYMRTAAEIAAGVTPVNFGYAPGDVRRYGADPTATADSSAAIAAAFLANVYVFGGGAGNIYKYNTSVALPKDIVFDGQGCTLRPVTSAQLYRNPPAADFTTTATLALNGSISVTVASTANLAIGQYVALNSPVNTIPFFWAVIKNIVGSVLTLDRAIGPVDYMSNTNSTGNFNWQATTTYAYGDFVTNGGNIYFCAIPGQSAGSGGPTGTTPNSAIADNLATWVYWGPINVNVYKTDNTTLWQRCHFKNIDWDGSLYTTPTSTGMCLRASTYRSTIVENMRFFNFSVNNNQEPVLVGLYYGLDCKVRELTFEENILATTTSAGPAVDMQGFRQCGVDENTIMGSGFGMDVSYCEHATVTGNILHGTKSYERAVGTALPFSARGIKATRCGEIVFTGNTATDYESPYRTDQGIRATFNGNKIRNPDVVQGAFTNTTGNAINCTSAYCPIQQYYVVTGNTVENCGGAAIAISSGVGVFSGRHVVSNNTVRGANAYGIYCTDADCQFEGNRVQEWGRAGAATYGAINVTAKGHIIRGNRFRPVATDSTSWAIPTLPTGGGIWVIDGNTFDTGFTNPLIQGGLGVEWSGATTIAAGGTSQTITHKLPTGFTPDATMVTLMPQAAPTNAQTSQVFANTFTGTQFNINASAAPGVGGWAIAWRIKLPQPFTL